MVSDPDGLMLIPWCRGRSLIWDVMVVDTIFYLSYLHAKSAEAGAAAELAAIRKNTKYNELLSTHLFVLLALETMGPINISGLEFLKDLGRCLSSITGDHKETCLLLQRIAVVVTIITTTIIITILIIQ